MADLIAGGIPLIAILLINLYRRPRGHHQLHNRKERLSRWGQVSMMVIVLFFGWIGVNFTGILWTDFLLVVFALLLHRPLESFVERTLVHIRGLWKS